VATYPTNFLYGGPDIVAEYPSNWGTPTAQYTHGPNQDEPIERITQTGAQYFHHDGLGSVVGVTNNLGGTDATQRFDAWGNQIASTGTQTRYGYTGREPDETGLIYYRARYYDPAVGRFVSRDPIGLGGGINQYAYVNGNPVNYTDPLGLMAANPQSIMLADGGKNYFSNTMTDISNGLTSAVQSLSKVVPGAEAMNNATANFNTGNYGTAALWGVGALADAAFAVGTGGESTAAKTVVKEGSFSIVDWARYPASVPKPPGSVNLLGGAEYNASRAAANAENRAIHNADSSLAGQHIHEIQPVKFGGSPTDSANKVVLDPATHYQLNTWWKDLQRYIENINK